MLTALFAHAWALNWQRFAVAAGFTLVFALVGRAVRGVNWSGAAGGAAACFALFAGMGPAGFALLATLFLATLLSTRIGYARKQKLGLAERREGRNARQVLANLAVAALCAILFAARGSHIWLVATVAALAEAATDTVASEIGQVGSDHARLITTWQRVRPGVDGGITFSGTFAGLLGGLLLCMVAVVGGILMPSEMWIPVTAGFTGMLADSFLGATIQRRGWISNQAVNLCATLAAAALAYLLSV